MLRHPINVVTTLLAISILLMAPSQSQAHVIPEVACHTQWRIAPTGEKWQAQQGCLKYVRAHHLAHQCRKLSTPTSVTVKGVRISWRLAQRGNSKTAREHREYGRNQRKVLAYIVNEGRRRGARPKVIITAIATTTQEAQAIELRGGDGSSSGPFQLISSHGDASIRRTVEFSTNWHYNRSIGIDRQRPHLSINDLAQATQASGHPYAYGQWAPEAQRTYRLILGACPR